MTCGTNKRSVCASRKEESGGDDGAGSWRERGKIKRHLIAIVQARNV